MVEKNKRKRKRMKTGWKFFEVWGFSNPAVRNNGQAFIKVDPRSSFF
jgi:hypothetical protein